MAKPARPMTNEEKEPLRAQFRPLVRAIYAGIVANAVVTPAGSPAMAAGGDPVTGTGRVS